MFNLARAYQAGDGVAQDDALSLSWFQNSANKGYSFAFEQLGYIYENGIGVAANPQMAAENYYNGLIRGRDWIVTRPNEQWNRDTARALQGLLKSAGYYSGVVDGVMGNSTHSALKAALNSENT